MGVILKWGSPGEPTLSSHENQTLVLPTVLRITINFQSLFSWEPRLGSLGEPAQRQVLPENQLKGKFSQRTTFKTSFKNYPLILNSGSYENQGLVLLDFERRSDGSQENWGSVL